MTAEIISVGTELLLGNILTNIRRIPNKDAVDDIIKCTYQHPNNRRYGETDE